MWKDISMRITISDITVLVICEMLFCRKYKLQKKGQYNAILKFSYSVKHLMSFLTNPFYAIIASGCRDIRFFVTTVFFVIINDQCNKVNNPYLDDLRLYQ